MTIAHFTLLYLLQKDIKNIKNLGYKLFTDSDAIELLELCINNKVPKDLFIKINTEVRKKENDLLKHSLSIKTNKRRIYMNVWIRNNKLINVENPYII